MPPLPCGQQRFSEVLAKACSEWKGNVFVLVPIAIYKYSAVISSSFKAKILELQLLCKSPQCSLQPNLFRTNSANLQADCGFSLCAFDTVYILSFVMGETTGKGILNMRGPCFKFGVDLAELYRATLQFQRSRYALIFFESNI